MRKPIAAAMLCAAVLSAAIPGSAATVRAGLCSFVGSTSFDIPVTVDFEVNSFLFTGDLQCAGSIGSAAVDPNDPQPPNPSATGESFTGTVEVLGAGNASCLITNLSGTLTATIPTGEGTRDVWSGAVAVVGSAQSAIFGNISQIEHQSFDAVAGEWVTTSSDAPRNTLIAGAITSALSQADLDACQAGGVSTLSSSGTAAFAYSL